MLGEYSIYDAKLGATRQYDGLTLDMLYPFYHRNGRTLIGQGYFGYLFETAVTDVTPRYSLGGFTRYLAIARMRFQVVTPVLFHSWAISALMSVR